MSQRDFVEFDMDEVMRGGPAEDVVVQQMVHIRNRVGQRGTLILTPLQFSALRQYIRHHLARAVQSPGDTQNSASDTLNLTQPQVSALRELIQFWQSFRAQQTVPAQLAGGVSNSSSSASTPSHPFFKEPTERKRFRNIARVYQFDTHPDSPADLTKCLTALQKELLPHIQQLLQQHRGIKLALALNVEYQWSIPKIQYSPRIQAALRTNFEVLYPANSIPEYLEKVCPYNIFYSSYIVFR